MEMSFSRVFNEVNPHLVLHLLKYYANDDGIFKVINFNLINKSIYNVIKSNENNGKFWKKLTNLCWTIDWELYNDKITSTFQGFSALCYYWSQLKARVSFNLENGNKVLNVYDKGSNVHFILVRNNNDDDGMCVILVPVIPKHDMGWNDAFIQISSNNVIVTRETLMYLHPKCFQYIKKEDMPYNFIGKILVLHRVLKPVNRSNGICVCGTCGIGNNLILQSSEDVAELIQETYDNLRPDTDFTGLRFVDFITYEYNSLSIYDFIIVEYINYIYENKGKLPNTSYQSYFMVSNVSMIPYNFARKIINEIYELFLQFIHLIGPKKWEECYTNINDLIYQFGNFYDSYCRVNGFP